MSCGIVLWHVVGRGIVGIVLVGIEVVHARRLRVDAETAPQRQPVGQFYAQVGTGRECKGAHVVEGLHGGETGTQLQAQAPLAPVLPAEIVFYVGRHLVQTRYIAEGSWPAAAVRLQRQTLVIVIVATSAVPVVLVFHTHLEVLVGLPALQVEAVINLGKQVTGPALVVACGFVGGVHELQSVVACGHGCVDGGQSAAGKGRVLRVRLCQAESYGV